MDEPHNHPPKPNDTNPHENRDRLNSRKNSRKPGVDRSPPCPVMYCTSREQLQNGHSYRYLSGKFGTR